MLATGWCVEVPGNDGRCERRRKAVPRRSRGVRDAGRPARERRECRPVAGGRRQARHDESRMAGDTRVPARWSTTSMLPSSHRGHRRNERPVSAS